jgi:hypothetical protein
MATDDVPADLYIILKLAGLAVLHVQYLTATFDTNACQ